MIHLENNFFFFSFLENAVNSVFIRCAGLTPWQTSSTVCRRTSLHVELPAPLACAFGVILWGSTAAPHGLLFGTGVPTTQRPCNKSTMTLKPGSEAASSDSHQLAMWLPVPCPGHIQPLLCPDLYPPLFPVYLSFMFMTLIISESGSFSLTGLLDCTIYLSLLYFGFKRHPQLGDGREMEGVGVDAIISAW